MNKVYAALTVLLLSSAAQAAPVGPAGCGLGNMVFGKDMQILASTTNGTSGNQTFGITSGTSNCGGSGSTAQLENFIEVNQVAVANDVARGEGETIVSLAQILGCQNAAELGTELKKNYSDIFSRPGVSSRELTNGVYNAIQKNNSLSLSCGNV
jgi:hypothetical protein